MSATTQGSSVYKSNEIGQEQDILHLVLPDQGAPHEAKDYLVALLKLTNV